MPKERFEIQEETEDLIRFDPNTETFDTAAFRHLTECPGCVKCTYLVEFYSYCGSCEQPGHISTLRWIEETGEYICEGCEEEPTTP